MSKSAKITLIAIISAIVIAIASISAISMQKNSHEYMLSLAERYLSELDYEQAIIQFEKLIEIEPKNTDAYLKLADAYYQNGDIDRGIEVLQKALQNVDDENIKLKLEEYERIKNPPITTTTTVTTTAPVTTTTTTVTTAAPVTTTLATTTTPETTTTVTTEEPFVVETVVICGVEYQTDITELDLSDKKFTQEDLDNLAKCKKIVSLNMDSSELDTFIGTPTEKYSFISEMKDLEKLTLPSLCDLSVAADLINLKYLKTSDPLMVVYDPRLGYLENLVNLEELYITPSYWQLDGITAIKNLKNLRILQIYGPYLDGYINQDNIDIFTSLTTLEILYVGYISDECKQTLVEALPDCTIKISQWD